MQRPLFSQIAQLITNCSFLYTHSELELLAKRVSTICPVIKDSMNHGSLVIAENGQGSPCLDLSRLDGALVALMTMMAVDLVILEGTGRAIHTNYVLNSRSVHLRIVESGGLEKTTGWQIDLAEKCSA